MAPRGIGTQTVRALQCGTLIRTGTFGVVRLAYQIAAV